MASLGQTSTPIQYSMRNLLTNQPLDFSTPSPPISHQPPHEILDLCVRRNEPAAVKSEPPSPADPNQPLIHHPITILQQHLMQTVPRLPLREERTKSPGSPEYCSTSSERSEPSRMSPQNLGLLVAGLQPYPMLPALPQMLNANGRSKPTRPFKAYPKDPLTLSVGVSAADSFLGHGSNEAYSEFRRRMLDQVQSSNTGTNSNKARSNMKRPLSPEPPTSSDAYNANGIPSSPEEGKDAAYWERRRKNNEAAKRSRDARRHKEDEIAIRAAFLEQENMKLKYELAAMRNETAKLRCLLYNS